MERAVLRPSYHPFQRRIGRMRDFFPKLPAPLSQIRKTKGLAGNKSKVGGYVSEELSLRGREESRMSSSPWLMGLKNSAAIFLTSRSGIVAGASLMRFCFLTLLPSTNWSYRGLIYQNLPSTLGLGSWNLRRAICSTSSFREDGAVRFVSARNISHQGDH